MPCSDSSSSISIHLDNEERFISFDYAKITCGREITGGTGLNRYFVGWELQDILTSSFANIQKDLNITEEDAQFILYLEWDALRSAIGQYLGTDDKNIDKDRCRITSIDYSDEGIEISQVILPPKELPKILPCSLGDKN